MRRAFLITTVLSRQFQSWRNQRKFQKLQIIFTSSMFKNGLFCHTLSQGWEPRGVALLIGTHIGWGICKCAVWVTDQAVSGLVYCVLLTLINCHTIVSYCCSKFVWLWVHFFCFAFCYRSFHFKVSYFEMSLLSFWTTSLTGVLGFGMEWHCHYPDHFQKNVMSPIPNRHTAQGMAPVSLMFPPAMECDVCVMTTIVGTPALQD